MLITIWAEAANGIIGNNGKLPWYFPEELKHFKQQTLGKTVVFGYQTLEGLGWRTLPGRNVVLYSDRKTSATVPVLNCNEILELSQVADVVIAGGKQTYETFLPMTDKIIRTVIHESFDGDTFAPKFDGFILTNVEYYEHWDIETYERKKAHESV